MNANVTNWGYDMRGGQYPKRPVDLSVHYQVWSFKYTFQGPSLGKKSKLLTFCNNNNKETKLKTEQKIVRW